MIQSIAWLFRAFWITFFIFIQTIDTVQAESSQSLKDEYVQWSSMKIYIIFKIFQDTWKFLGLNS